VLKINTFYHILRWQLNVTIFEENQVAKNMKKENKEISCHILNMKQY